MRGLQFTGGEPFLYPQIFEAFLYASSKGFLTSVATNGSLIDEKKAALIRKCHVNNLEISIDHFNKKIIEENRGIKDIQEKIENAIKFLKIQNMNVQGLTTISRLNYLDLEKILEYQSQIGIKGTTFCYPMVSMDSTFKLGGDSKYVTFSKEELIEILIEIKKLHKKYNILNPVESIDDIIRFLEGKKVKFECLGGSKIFYLDWNLDLHKCMKKNEKISIFDSDNFFGNKTSCNECIHECFRDPSIFYHGFKSIIPLIRFAKKGQKVYNFI